MGTLEWAKEAILQNGYKTSVVLPGEARMKTLVGLDGGYGATGGVRTFRKSCSGNVARGHIYVKGVRFRAKRGSLGEDKKSFRVKESRHTLGL